MKLSKAKKAILATKLTDIASNVALKPVFVISRVDSNYDIINYYTKAVVIREIPSKGLANFLCDSLNKTKKKLPVEAIQYHINVYSKHYYDCIFYKHTIKTTKDTFKKHMTITRLDLSIEHLKLAVSNLRKTC